MEDSTPHWDAEFETPDGRVVTQHQIGFFVRYENTDVEKVDEGILVDGEFYRRVDNGTNS